jgi:VWFA-related protein
MRNPITRLASPVLLLAFAASAAHGNAQDPAPIRQDSTPFVLGTEIVLLDVSIVDHSGRPVPGLQKDRFVVNEDGAPQDLAFFSVGQAPASIALVLDTSASMRTKIEQTAAAAARVLDGARPGDEFAVIEFKDTPNLIQDFTSDPLEVRAALGRLDVAGQTAMLDAAYLSADYVHEHARNRLKAVVLVTDGLDKHSYYSFGKLVEHLHALDVRMYLIGLTSDLDPKGGFLLKSERQKAEDLLTKLATETAGQAFFPARLEDLSAVNDAIATDLRTVYSIGYYPKNEKKDGTFRKVDVHVFGKDGKDDPALVVRTRAGYIAPTS